MPQQSLPAVFMRGGTSKALMLHARDLPAERAEWAPLFMAAMGTPDPYGRQLDGMGGGISSLSKVCVIAPSERPDADVDYTFAQVLVKEPRVDYGGNCGNMSSAVGPFAIDEGLVRPQSASSATVRIFNTNTRKLIHATFPVAQGRACYGGDLVIPGVSGSGGPIRLDFLDPGGATTGRLLPTGRPLDILEVPGFGRLEASLVDAANAAVFVRAADLGLSGREMPDAIDARPDLLALLQAIRIEASIRMGIAPDRETARSISMVPFICMVSQPSPSEEPQAADLVVRALSNGQAHRALPLTISLCTGVAAQITGTLVAEATAEVAEAGRLRLAMPSGILTVGAEVAATPDGWSAPSGSFYRTARRLFDGRVWLDAGDSRSRSSAASP